MKTIKFFIFSVLFFIVGCHDSLDVTPKGVISEDQINTPEQADGLVTAAYAWLPLAHAFDTYNPWIASLRSDDAYKGGGGISDQPAWYHMEVFSLVTPNVGNNDGVWFRGFSGISRVNTAIRAINKFDDSEYPKKTERIAEMRFIRGWIYLKMKERWRWVPYIDESMESEDIENVSNRPSDMESDLELWNLILDDFKFAIDNLPPQQVEVGRANKYIAEAYAAKCLMWMAYPLDDNNQLMSVDNGKLSEALTYIDDVINNGGFELADNFAYNFLGEYDNKSPESIWELQFSIDDGTERGNVNNGNGLTAPWWNPYFNCCDFHKPTYNMVNAFRVDENGLPLFETFNDAEARNNYHNYFSENTFDPRLGHTVAIPGFPWKYSPIPYDSSGSRDPGIYGYFHSLKENVKTDFEGQLDEFWMYNSKNQIEVRLAEVMLWKAEILVQLNRHEEALPIINAIRSRALNSTDILKLPDGSFPTQYDIGLYIDGENCNWTHEFAWEALMWENRLEMAMEGRRFYDLVRWGIVEETMNDYFEKEKERRSWLKDGRFTSGRDEFLPIPQNQMNWAKGIYVQNAGY